MIGGDAGQYDDGGHLVGHDGLHQLILKGLSISPHCCREKGNLQNCCLEFIKTAKNENNIKNKDDEDDLGPPIDQPGIGEHLVTEARHLTTAAVTPFTFA